MTTAELKSESRLPSREGRRRPGTARRDGARAAPAAPARLELIRRIRAQIAEGRYETPERLDAALDALIRDALDPPRTRATRRPTGKRARRGSGYIGL